MSERERDSEHHKLYYQLIAAQHMAEKLDEQATADGDTVRHHYYAQCGWMIEKALDELAEVDAL
jgi:hypothetical protein